MVKAVTEILGVVGIATEIIMVVEEVLASPCWLQRSPSTMKIN
jgi:hypothetical protein